MKLKYGLANLRIALRLLRALGFIFGIERKEGTLGQTLKLTRSKKDLLFKRDWTFGELLEWSAMRYGHNPFLSYREIRMSFVDLNLAANRIAHGMSQAGIQKGDGVAIMMTNHPAFLEVFFAIQKIGGYAVPVNVGLVGDGLAYILNHSEVQSVFLDAETAPKVADVRDRLDRIERFYVLTEEAEAEFSLPEGMEDLQTLRNPQHPSADPGVQPEEGAPALLLYTSGTTGLPKAVVYGHRRSSVKKLGVGSKIFYGPTDKLYTCLPLFHANALMLTTMQGLWLGIPIALGKRFSASRFWREVSESEATTFNALGAMIPILLKTSPSPYDKNHKVKKITSSACPVDAWVPFEERFNVKIAEAYGAVDGGGNIIFNDGTAPIGSLGKPRGVEYRLADDAGNPVPVGTPGELLFRAGDNDSSSVHYFKNEKASNEKVKNGWLHTGDLVRADGDGFLYFVGRNSDSMRRRGENVSAYEVEKQIDGHPDVLESAVFGVPAELGEDDIMACVVPVEGKSLEVLGDLVPYLRQRLAKYAVPRYYEVLDEIPKTGTHRVQKSELKKRGVTPETVDAETPR